MISISKVKNILIGLSESVGDRVTGVGPIEISSDKKIVASPFTNAVVNLAIDCVKNKRSAPEAVNDYLSIARDHNLLSEVSPEFINKVGIELKNINPEASFGLHEKKQLEETITTLIQLNVIHKNLDNILEPEVINSVASHLNVMTISDLKTDKAKSADMGGYTELHPKSQDKKAKVDISPEIDTKAEVDQDNTTNPSKESDKGHDGSR